MAAQRSTPDDPPPATTRTGVTEREVIPRVEEQLVVERRERIGTTVQVQTHTHEREETIDEVLRDETVEVLRVPIDRYVDAPDSIRREGDTTIVPVHEEVLFVEKRLLLKEEVHITKRTRERRERQRVSVRSQSADVDRTEPEDA
jgi:stress response protein YsnF